MTDAEDVEMNVETKKKAKKDKKDKAAAEEGETKETKSAEPAFDPTTVTGAISIIANPLAVRCARWPLRDSSSQLLLISSLVMRLRRARSCPRRSTSW